MKRGKGIGGKGSTRCHESRATGRRCPVVLWPTHPVAPKPGRVRRTSDERVPFASFLTMVLSVSAGALTIPATPLAAAVPVNSERRS